jgi:hypothetical protein
VVRARRHHARTEIVEVDRKHKVLVAVLKALEISLSRHLGRLRSERTTSVDEMLLEMLKHVRFDGGRLSVSTRLLDQRRDKISLFKNILESDHIQMRPANKRRASGVVRSFKVWRKRRVAGSGRRKTGGSQIAQERRTREQVRYSLQIALDGVLCILSLVVVAMIHVAVRLKRERSLEANRLACTDYEVSCVRESNGKVALQVRKTRRAYSPRPNNARFLLDSTFTFTATLCRPH